MGDRAVNSIYGLYPNPSAAERALGWLRANALRLNFPSQDIVVMCSEPFDEYDLGWREQRTAMPWIAAGVAVCGGTLAYLLAALTQRSYPLPTGGMPIVAMWPTGVVIYELTMLGAILSTLITLLITARLPNWRTKLYDPAVSDGKILVGVLSAPASAVEELKQHLGKAGAEAVKETPNSLQGR
jgi:Alternative complex III, ActD subunit